MTEQMQTVLAKVSLLPPTEQDVIATRISEALAEFAEARFWIAELSASDAPIDRLAVEALEDHLQGKTRPLQELLEESD